MDLRRTKKDEGEGKNDKAGLFLLLDYSGMCCSLLVANRHISGLPAASWTDANNLMPSTTSGSISEYAVEPSIVALVMQFIS